MRITVLKLFALLLTLQAALSLSVSLSHDQSRDFCWKDSYGRGVGKIPTQCGKRQKLGLLCYDACPNGYSRKALDCHQNCPKDFKDEGLFCRQAQYGRGGGYPWKFGDGLNDKGMYSRCEKDKGKGNCEKSGAIVYPKCKAGFHAIGCCICRPAVPNCKGIGLNGGLDLSCAKFIKIGTPHVPQCAANQDEDAGLCYPKCRAGYSGVGPVCWASAPKGWVGCGMGAASSSSKCASIILGQISSVCQMAVSIATLGAGGEAMTGANAAKVASKGGKGGKLSADMEKLFAKGTASYNKLKDKFTKIKQSVTDSKSLGGLVKKAQDLKRDGKAAKDKIDKANEIINKAQTIAQANPNVMTAADYVQMSASIAAISDPTGIASVVENFSYPKCSQIFH